MNVTFNCISKMLAVVLDCIRGEFEEKYGKDIPYKITFYSEFKFKKLVVMVEIMSEKKEYKPVPEDQAE